MNEVLKNLESSIKSQKMEELEKNSDKKMETEDQTQPNMDDLLKNESVKNSRKILRNLLKIILKRKD